MDILFMTLFQSVTFSTSMKNTEKKLWNFAIKPFFLVENEKYISQIAFGFISFINLGLQGYYTKRIDFPFDCNENKQPKWASVDDMLDIRKQRKKNEALILTRIRNVVRRWSHHVNNAKQSTTRLKRKKREQCNSRFQSNKSQHFSPYQFRFPFHTCIL